MFRIPNLSWTVRTSFHIVCTPYAHVNSEERIFPVSDKPEDQEIAALCLLLHLSAQLDCPAPSLNLLGLAAETALMELYNSYYESIRVPSRCTRRLLVDGPEDNT